MARSALTLPAIALLLVCLALAGAACNVSTANLSQVRSCTELKDGKCEKDMATIPAKTPVIYVSTNLNNAPDGTELTFKWRYLEGDGVDITSVKLETKDGENTAQSSLTQPDAGWPAGKYEVILELGTDNSTPVHKRFEVK